MKSGNIIKTLVTAGMLTIPTPVAKEYVSIPSQEEIAIRLEELSKKIYNVLLSTDHESTYRIDDAVSSIPHQGRELVLQLPISSVFETYNIN